MIVTLHCLVIVKMIWKMTTRLVTELRLDVSGSAVYRCIWLSCVWMYLAQLCMDVSGSVVYGCIWLNGVEIYLAKWDIDIISG